MKVLKHITWFIYNLMAFGSAVALGIGIHTLMTPRYSSYRSRYNGYSPYSGRYNWGHKYASFYDRSKETEDTEDEKITEE